LLTGPEESGGRPCRDIHTVPKGVGKRAMYGMLERGDAGITSKIPGYV